MADQLNQNVEDDEKVLVKAFYFGPIQFLILLFALFIGGLGVSLLAGGRLEEYLEIFRGRDAEVLIYFYVMPVALFLLSLHGNTTVTTKRVLRENLFGKKVLLSSWDNVHRVTEAKNSLIIDMQNGFRIKVRSKQAKEVKAQFDELINKQISG